MLKIPVVLTVLIALGQGAPAQTETQYGQFTRYVSCESWPVLASTHFCAGRVISSSTTRRVSRVVAAAATTNSSGFTRRSLETSGMTDGTDS